MIFPVRHVLALLALALLPSMPTSGATAAALPARLALAAALTRMRSNDPALGVAEVAIAQADADRFTAGERPNATLSWSTAKVDLGGHNGTGSLWDKQYDTIVALSQPFERGAKRRHRVEQATAALGATEADFADTLRRERLAVTQAYWELKRAQEKRSSARALDEIEHRALHGAEARLQHGDIASLDVERLRLDAAQADNAADQADAALTDARIALAALLDATVGADLLEAIDDWPTSVAITTDAETALQRRPDVLAAQQRVSAAQAALDLAHAQRHRDITLSGQYEHNPTPGSGPGYGDNMVGIGVSVPLFTGNHYEGEIRRANADLDAAEALLAQTRIASRADFGRAIADARAADARVRRYDSDLVARARRAEQTSETAYTRGGLALAELLDARRDLKAVEDAATDARADFADAIAALDAAAPSPDTAK